MSLRTPEHDLQKQVEDLESRLKEYQRIVGLPAGPAYHNAVAQLPTFQLPPPDVREAPSSLFQKFNETMGMPQSSSLITKGLGADNTLKVPEAYTQPFCDFLTENPTVFHAVDYFERKLGKAGFTKVCQATPLLL